MSFAGKYTVERILGCGGMGVVFEARHVRLAHRVAIKVLGQALRDYPELVTRFEREARAAGALSSPHAVKVFDIDATADKTPFIVMELLSGEDLGRLLERDGPQPVDRVLSWIRQASRAIAEAHSLGIIHRDIKPSNLFLCDLDGETIVKVLDFGIAKHAASKEAAITQAVAPLGTPQYMSPEQVRCAKNVDARTDIWSLGVTIYELVTGQPPFSHDSPSACIASIAADPVPDPRTLRPDLPADFVDALMKALAKDPKERYPSVAAMMDALAPFAAPEAEDTGVRRAVAAPRPASSSSPTTIGEAEIAAARPEPETIDVGAQAIDAREDGDHATPAPLDIVPLLALQRAVDRTAPPVARPRSAPKRRLRPTIAIASAAVLGVVALVATPKCVREPEAPASAIAATTPVATAPAAPVAPVDLASAPAQAVAPAAAPQPEDDAPAVALEPTGATIELDDNAKRAHDVEARRPAHASKAAAVAKAEIKHVARAEPSPHKALPVHGGLSGPGF